MLRRPPFSGRVHGAGPRRPHVRRRLAPVWGVVLATTVVVPAMVAAPAGPAAAGSLTNWTTYHGDPLSTGVSPSTATFTNPTRAWTSPVLDGQLFGEPLVLGSLVLVATENDTVYALNASDGTVAWSTSVGTAVPATSLPCGDISPTVGITSTPVIDAARSEVFVVADELSGATITHHLVGLGTAAGNVLLDEVVDPPGTTTAAQLQRPALALDQGAVLVAFGGNAGDCSTYHGWLVSAPETGASPTDFEVDASLGNHEGAIWMGGASPVVDPGGNIWVTTGNGSNTSGASPDGSDSVIELSPALHVLQSFTPSTWQNDNAVDADLGSSAPAILGNGLVFQAGKSRTAYVLNAFNLGGVGHQVSLKRSFCGSTVDGGVAVTSTALYIPCLKGLQAVRITPHDAVHVMWRTRTGSTGPAIVAGGLVWTLHRDGVLYGLREKNGRVAVQLTVGAPANHFPTPSVGAGLLLAASADRVVAFH
ncbi:MAG TPA: PQQ-binding-like beta-propeller repeat protein [Acidimicrobiales bacterium]|nr:PQQ-binding-like beta-propeller repeat protein [Acidimicrobiales bacterium]